MRRKRPRDSFQYAAEGILHCFRTQRHMQFHFLMMILVLSSGLLLGLQTNAQYCDGISTPYNTKFVDEYHAQYNTYPGYYSDAGYTKARLLVAALKKLNGVTSNKKAVAAAMRSTPIVAARGPVRLSGAPAFAPIQNIYICEVKQVAGALRNVPIKTYTAVKPWGSLSQSAWESNFRKDSAGRPS